MNPTLIVRADSNTEMGTGHFMRCLALGQEWIDRGGKVKLLYCEMLPSLLARAQQEGFQLLKVPGPIGSEQDLGGLCQELRNGNSYCVVDGYGFTDSYVSVAAKASQGLLALDDYGHLSGGGAYSILNQNVHAQRELYPKAPLENLLLGLSYSLLRKEIRHWSPRKSETPAGIEHLLVFLGGGDPENFTLAVLKALRRCQERLARVTVLIGAGHPDPESLAEEGKQWGPGLRLERDRKDMGELLVNSDFAICAGGSILWELCYFGVPPLVLTTAENHSGNGAGLERKGFAVDLGWAKALDPVRLKTELECLLDRDTRTARAKIGTTLVDGQGCRRVVDALLGKSSLGSPS